MNKALQKKLLSYSALATSLLAIEKSADAQIVYHKVDTVINAPGYYQLDLNGDGTYDFELNFSSWLSERYTSYHGGATYFYYRLSAGVQALHSNRVGQSFLSSTGFVRSSIIDRKGISFQSYSFGNVVGYVPLKLVKGANTYLGWVRLDFSKSFKIIEYAYKINSSDSILVGNTNCSPQPPTPTIILKGSDTLVSTNSLKYQWYLNGSNIASDTTKSIIAPTFGVYSVITTDSSGCKSQSYGVNYSDCNSFHPQLNSNYTVGCDTLLAEMKLDSIPYGYNIIWYQNNQVLQLSNPLVFNKYLYGYSDPTTTYYIITTNLLNSCSDTSNIVTYKVYERPFGPAIGQNVDTLEANFKGNYTYQWYYDSTLIKGAILSYFVPNLSGSYTVDIAPVGDSVCDSYSAAYLFKTTGLLNLSDNTIKVYPINNTIVIDFDGNQFFSGSIELYNLEGQKLQQQTISNSTEILNAQQYAKGIYFVSISKNGVRRIYKVALL